MEKMYVITENGVTYYAGGISNHDRGMSFEEAVAQLERFHNDWITETFHNYTPIVQFGTYFAQYRISKNNEIIEVKRYQVTPIEEAIESNI